ncbi:MULTISPECIES: TIGR03086 family metal-binding protein [unclassified Nocardioides]|uniref:TIGR03086 family metal-binding protein n=1 Tax=Nocardioides sp. URHA0032 TaxID=1380388 RepID=UPI00048A4526|nr:TIGR03086 family metal-binding protein [Nocardioides sp. URHA0032]
MTATLGGSVELLERALGYTRARLGRVHDDLLDRPTPCEGWTLGDLLAHMEDALDAFTEAAGGEVVVRGGSRAAGRIAAIQDKACALLGAWGRPAPGDVVIATSAGGLDLMSTLLVATAALEVTVHGWDVGRATGECVAIPAELARELLPVAERVVGPADRGVRFAAPRPAAADAADDVRLLAHLGRT